MKNSRKNQDNQATTRLALIAIPLLGSIAFALLSLLGKLLESSTWQVLMQVASGLMGTLGLLTGVVALVFQIARKQLSLRNVVVFGCLYIMAVLVFLVSCTAMIGS